MKKFWLTLIFGVFFGSLLFAQTPTPTATPQSDEDDVVIINSSIIQFDVTVTDKNGKIVKDLKPEDFEIYENEKKQEITNFSFITATGEKISAPTTKKVDRNSIIPPAPLKSEQVKRTIALVVDDLTLSFESIASVRGALKKYVDQQMREGDLVAIIRTGGGVGALQQFTNDKRQLYAAIEKIRWNPTGTGRIGVFDPLGTEFGDINSQVDSILDAARGGDSGGSNANGGRSGVDARSRDEIRRKNVSAELNEFRQNVFGVGTLGALSYIVRGMKDISGRKSIVMFSDGISLFLKNDEGILEPSVILDSLRRLTDLANRSSVVVYTIDARGLQTLGLTAADNPVDVSGEALEQRLSERRNEFFETQEGLDYLARQTGGFPIRNSNDLAGGIEKIVEDQSGFYLIAYQPEAETFDATKSRYNKLRVKVKREGLTIRYRSGFFGVTDEQIRPQNKQTKYEKATTALISPFSKNEIVLRLNTFFGNDAKIGSYMRSFLHIQAKDLKFNKQENGTYKTSFSILAMSFNETGLTTDQLSKTYTLDVSEKVYNGILNDGLVYNFLFPIKKAGAYQMRVALIDEETEKVGSTNQFIEVPNVKKEKLLVSGIVLENLTAEQWAIINGENSQTASAISSDPMTDTSLRRFKRNTVLRYGAEIYNAKTDKALQKPVLTSQIKLFRNGSLFFEGKPSPIDLTGQTDLQRIKFSGAFAIGLKMQPGDYILQVLITDNANKEKNKIATQLIQFEIIE